jgi:hypothetical protein
METITVKYADGTTETFADCTVTGDTDLVLRFTGKLSGESTAKKHEITRSQVKRITRETQPGSDG